MIVFINLHKFLQKLRKDTNSSFISLGIVTKIDLIMILHRVFLKRRKVY